uniref:NADH-ubiquinone oxidoreductase chain 5 n=1 Tax=Echinothrix diadema TaxID=742515 RepID=A0A1L6Z5S7_ECHDI|nr:NADH dehydrogenase subunit 5 [Echinothrix diadema]APT41367.1 NADH dehydrogenase subunit 5 [Echinothrix diadema]
MVITSPSILAATILGSMLMLAISTFIFSKSLISSYTSLSTSKTALLGISQSHQDNSTITSFTTGPFAISILKVTALASLISLAVFAASDFQQFSITFSLWLNNTPTTVSLSMLYDQYSIIFITVALLVTWSIMEFSFYYMSEDPFESHFYRLLIIFLLNMLILTSSNSFFLIFLGWEGVGFLSFLLISWWLTRNDASSSALQAVIYNRVGDIGLITFMALSVLLFNSWNLTEILASSSLQAHYTPFLLFGLILAAAGKSAQFGLHPWLPAAMEGPTPVSALLHSSTMVVAGVFLLIRTAPLFEQQKFFQTTILVLGGLTAIFAATTAVAQHDIKKIIAYSTTSQLGLMVSAVGLGQPLLAFFHICTHAFFKAMLFMCSGSVIHSLGDQQDLRKMSGLSKLLPVTSSCLILGSLALMGTPFLAGFYSKDLILEAASAGFLNTLGLLLSLAATLLTAAYSFRIIYFCLLSQPSIGPLSPIGEENPNLANALLRLSMGTVLSGWFFSSFLFILPAFNVPPFSKILPLLVTVIGTFLLVVLLMFLSSALFSNNLHTAFTLQWFYSDIAHSLLTASSFFSSLLLSTRTLDRGWQEDAGPQGIASAATALTKVNQSSQTGLIKNYILSSLFLIFFLLILSWVSS